MSGRVKGVLFADYVRMLRAHGDLSWHEYLEPEDLPYLDQPVDPSAWYPMETFGRLGVAILQSIAEGDLGILRAWGRVSVADVAGALDQVIVPSDPRESLMRLSVLRSSLFDFEALTMLQLCDGSASFQIGHGMAAIAEQAVAVQTMGLMEGLIELADGTGLQASFVESSWRGDARTVLSLAWEGPSAA